MADAATQCIAELDRNKQDISMLFLFSKWDWLVRSKMGEDMLSWMETTMRMKRAQVDTKAFQAEVKKVFLSRGIKSIAPERAVHAVHKNDAKEMCVKAGWPKPFIPVMLQTRPPGAGGFKKKKGGQESDPGVFVIFSNWQDAFFALLKMTALTEYKGYPAEVVFENQVEIGDRYYPARIILDCDAKLTEFENKYTLEELEESIDQVPPWFLGQLVQIGALKATDEVTLVVKNKSRPEKASKHIIINVYGFAPMDIQNVLHRVFDPPRAAAKKKEEEEESGAAKKKAKKAGGAGGRRLPEPWRVTDPAMFHGRGQFSTLFCKSSVKNEKEFPSVEYQMTVVNGKVTSQRYTGKTADGVFARMPRGEFTPDHPDALGMLHCCCYTSLLADFVVLDPKFMSFKQQARRTSFYFLVTGVPAVRIELTNTPYGGREKVGGRRMLDQAMLEKPAPGSRKTSCRHGRSQPSSVSLVVGVTVSTQACQV